VCSSITVSQSIFLSFFFFSHVFDGLLWKEPYGQRQNLNLFIYQRPSSWFLFYLYLYLILLSLLIIITNKSLDFIKSQLGHHNISNESLIKLIRQLILTINGLIVTTMTNTNTQKEGNIGYKNKYRKTIVMQFSWEGDDFKLLIVIFKEWQHKMWILIVNILAL